MPIDRYTTYLSGGAISLDEETPGREPESIAAETMQDDLGFSHRARRNGEIEILRKQRVVTVLRGAAAREFADEAQRGDEAALQQTMARLTGNYKRGNERMASEHPRNRR